MSLLMELQPEQISGGDLQKGQNTACALMIYLPVWHWLLISEGICLTEVLHIYLCKKCALQPRWELVGILIFHKLWLCLHLPRAGSVCRLGAWLDRAQRSKASMGNSLGFDIQDTRKLLKIHPNKLFLFSTTTLQRDVAMIMLGTMIFINYFLVCTKNFFLLFMYENYVKKIFMSEKTNKKPQNTVIQQLAKQ